MTDVSSFWARRKAAVAAEEAEEIRVAEAAQRAEEIDGKDDADLLEEMGLPDPSTLQKGDDFSAFMSRDVPEHLRKRALRTLWRSNPVLANVDGLNEYDDDYRAAMLLQEPIKTAYQVGKGMKAHLDEMARQAKAKAEQEAMPEPEAVPTLALNDEAETEEKQEAAPPADVSVEPELSDEGHDVAVPRRMRFRFVEETV